MSDSNTNSNSSNSNANSNDGIILTVRLGTTVSFTIPPKGRADIIRITSTVADVKAVIAREEACGCCPVERQRLIYKGRILSDDNRTLEDYGVVTSNQTLYLVKSKGSVSSSAPSPTVTTSTTTPTGSSNRNTATIGGGGDVTSTATPVNTATNRFSMMQQMMQQQQRHGYLNNDNNNGIGNTTNPMATVFPNMSQMQEQLSQNPELMNNLMNSPMMQNFLNNPDMIRRMMDSHPEMQRVLENNPQLRAVLDDPELMRRSMEAMRDPSAMQNMMRNQELAMSQIENLPGGFNALRRMYEDVQEPMMDAMSSIGSSNNNSNNNSSTSTTSSTDNSSNSWASTGGAMPNPWGAPRASNMGRNTSFRPSVSSPSASTSTTAANTNPATTANMNTNTTNPWAELQGLAGNTGGASSPWAANTFPGGGIPPQMNLEQTISMLENPAINNMMQQLMADPNFVQQMMDSNPMMQRIRQANPAAAQMMSNPETMRAMMDPTNLRAIVQAQQAMQAMGGGNVPPGFSPFGFPPSLPSNTNGTGPGAPSFDNGTNGSMDFSSLLNQFGNASVSSHAAPPANPEQRFENQLNALNEMGFTNREANIRALTACNGNVNRAVEMLINESAN